MLPVKLDWVLLIQIFLGLHFLIGLRVTALRWLALSRLSTLSSLQNEEACDRLEGLVRRQKRICRRNLEVMDSVRLAAHVSIDECQYQFRHRRWNCSTVSARSVFGHALSHGTRESAFVHAISAAGVVHAVTRACSSGQLRRCGCDRTVKGRSPVGFQWAGCSDNVVYGSAFAAAFVDARERGRKAKSHRSLMNLHNNRAGRKAVEDQMRVECKCHGVSGSCEMKTCWRALPPFRAVGLRLKEKFDGASEVTQTTTEKTRAELAPKNLHFKRHTDRDLVYLVQSPDYCDANKKLGSPGTHGRVCNRTSKALDGCDLMCCGRGYRTRIVKVVERCMCKFHWCCTVKCKECEREVEENTCL